MHLGVEIVSHKSADSPDSHHTARGWGKLGRIDHFGAQNSPGEREKRDEVGIGARGDHTQIPKKWGVRGIGGFFGVTNEL